MIIHASHMAEARRAFYSLALLTFAMLVAVALPSPPGVKGVANYLPLHTALETLAMVIAGLVFAVGWNAKQHRLSRNILLLSALFLGVGLLDFSHTLSFAGMPDFVTPSGPEKAINFWLAARSLAALALLAVALLPWQATPVLPRAMVLSSVLFVVALLHVLFLFYPHLVPRTFVPGQGLTAGKVFFEYGLIGAYLLSAALFLARMRERRTFNAAGLLATACLAAMSEFFFTLYADVTDVYNFFGHLYKIAAYLFLYRAIFVETVQYPYDQLNASRNQLQATLDMLPDLLFEVDAEGRFVDVHASNPGLLAAPVQSIMGKDLQEILPGDAARLGLAALAEAREQGYSRGQRIALDVPAGRRWFELSIGRKQGNAGEQPTYLVLSRDVTDLVERQAMIEWEARLNAAQLALPAEAELRHEQGFVQFGIVQIEKLTANQVGFIHLVDDDQGTIELAAWTGNAHAPREKPGSRYPVAQPGVWADAMRERKPVVFNDYAAVRQGTAHGVDELSRLVSVPVIDDGRVRMVVGVGNKREPYTEKDLETTQLMANAIWRIVSKRRMDETLRIKQEELDSFFTANLDLFCIATMQGEFVRVNSEWERVLGYSVAELEGRRFLDLVHPEDQETTLRAMVKLNRQQELPNFENRYRCKDGSYRDIEWRATPKGGRIYASARDVTGRKLREAEMRKLSLAIEQNPFPILITDPKANIEYVNPAFAEITGYGADESLGRNPSFLKSGKTERSIYEDMWAHLDKGEAWQGELVNLRKDGKEYTESVLIYPVRNSDGAITNYLAHIEDISAKKLAAERIRQLSSYDQLTGLPNRSLLEERFNHSVERVRAHGGKLAMMWLDLDNFKEINDALGHAVGDLLLREVADRLRAVLHDQDTISRQSGDDFIIVVPEAAQNEAALMAARLMNSLSRPIVLDGEELIITASTGIAVYPNDGDTLGALLMCSEAAMYRAKADGRNSYRFFAQGMQEGASRMLALGTAMKQALSRNEFHLVYQPQVDLKTGAVCGAEALLRWRHPKLGEICPAEFVPIAENNGQIVQIGQWVLHTVLQQLKQWERIGLPPVTVAVNVSAQQFSNPAFPEMLARLASDIGMAPASLEIELTEAVAMRDPAMASRTMEELDRRGFRLAIDDFGTGYSSLSYLKRFAVEKLKIDQSFIRELCTNQDDQAIVTAIIQMAHGLEIKIVAEGVETPEQQAFLRDKGCDEIQGFLYGHPLKAEEFEAFLRSGPPAAVA